MKTLVTRTLALASLAVLFAVTGSSQTAAKAGGDFYSELAKQNIRGLPNDEQFAAISPYLSKEIVALIKRDRRKQAAFIKKNPDEKPPWIEGDLFSSLFEGRSSFKIGRVQRMSTATLVNVDLEYDEGGEKPATWTDTAVMKKIGDKWVVTNILFKGKWQFKSGSSLLNVLK